MARVPIVMPQMGESIAEGTILRWLRKVNDRVQADEIIVEVETDKANVEIESPATGILVSCLKQEGEIAAAGEVIGYIEAEEEVPLTEEGQETVGEITTGKEVSRRPERRFEQKIPEVDQAYFSPYVLRLAMINGITLEELRSLRGSGVNGRITKRDILEYLARRPVATPSVEGIVGKPTPDDAELSALGKVVPMSAIRKTIADHMVMSVRTSAHVTMVHPVDMSRAVSLRKEYRESFQQRHQARLSYTAMMMYACSRVLPDFPLVNSVVYGSNIILRDEINIGCAVALADESLVVPVVRHADRKGFPQIARDLAHLIYLARERALKREHVERGTFTISNFGAHGSIIGTPIINQPQVAILGMGAIFRGPVVEDDRIVPRDMMYMSLSFDHRVIDGELGGRFLRTLQERMESFSAEELELA